MQQLSISGCSKSFFLKTSLQKQVSFTQFMNTSSISGCFLAVFSIMILEIYWVRFLLSCHIQKTLCRTSPRMSERQLKEQRKYKGRGFQSHFWSTGRERHAASSVLCPSLPPSQPIQCPSKCCMFTVTWWQKLYFSSTSKISETISRSHFIQLGPFFQIRAP